MFYTDMRSILMILCWHSKALALRELANYTDGGGDAAVQAGKDLKAQLATFEGLTRAEFDVLNIGP